ncbi:MAG: HAD family phosphatase [Nitrososphaerota archaeon]|nr:HAD family phosphatase [Nitrososphaerota archaeon]MDG6929695.1 HAD family phosphatase [Nitrososphaerota archaeon]
MMVLFTDYDRTITDKELELCSKVINKIAELRNARILRFIVASGRTLEFLQGKLSDFADGFVAENGAIIYYNGKKEVFGKSESDQIRTALYRVKDLVYFGEVIGYALKDAEPMIRDALESQRIDFSIEKNKNSIMVMPQFINKGFGITKIAEAMGLGGAKKIAMGDDENDISMLRAVDLPVALGNSDSRLKAIAKLVTEKEYCDGALEFLEELSLRADTKLP